MRPAHGSSLAIALAALIAAAPAGAASGPNLKLRNPQARIGAEVVRGAVTVRNVGNRRAGRSKIAVKAGGTTLIRVAVPRLRADRTRRIEFSAPLTKLAPGNRRLKLCADATRRIREIRERDNCRVIGRVVTPAPAPATPVSTVPNDPIAFDTDQRNYLAAAGGYWFWVPASYDTTHNTPTKLFLWLHGCGGMNQWEIYNVAPPPDGNYIALAPDGREGACWDMNADPTRVFGVLADVATHFNIDRRRIVLGGYSSGADLAYRTAFFNSRWIAGILVENASPFRDIGVSESAALAAAQFKFRTVHLAHTEDDTYQIALVRSEVATMQAAGFPVTLIERPGGHWENDTPTGGTNYDMRTLLLPYLAEDWTSPGG